MMTSVLFNWASAMRSSDARPGSLYLTIIAAPVSQEFHQSLRLWMVCSLKNVDRIADGPQCAFSPLDM
jgi:hypothetical protein